MIFTLSILKTPQLFFLFLFTFAYYSFAGTVDLGGANGFGSQELLIENYIWHPENEEAFKVYLKDFYKTVFSIEFSESDHHYSEISKEGFLYFYLKPWYKAPIELTKISSKKIGLYIPDELNVQNAIHRKENIQLDSNKYEKKELVEKARVILHETLMFIYLIPYIYTYDELFSHYKRIEPDLVESFYSLSAFGNLNNILDKARFTWNQRKDELLKEKGRLTHLKENSEILNSYDYENIRSMVDWAMNKIINNIPITKEDFYKKSYAHEFILLKPDVSTSPKDRTFDLSFLSSAVKSTLPYQSKNSLCMNGLTRQKFRCQVTIKFLDNENNMGTSTNFKNLIVSIEKKSKKINLHKSDCNQSCEHFKMSSSAFYFPDLNHTLFETYNEQSDLAYSTHGFISDETSNSLTTYPTYEYGKIYPYLTLVFNKFKKIIGLSLVYQLYLPNSPPPDNKENNKIAYSTFETLRNDEQYPNIIWSMDKEHLDEIWVSSPSF